MDNIYIEQYLKFHGNFIKQLKIIFPTEDTIEILNTIDQSSDESKLTNGQLFTSSISGDNLEIFVKNKIKVFSHKNNDTKVISESLFGPDFCIKNLLNNQSEEVKKVIWTNLHTLCMIGEMLKPQEDINKIKIKLLNQVISNVNTDDDESNDSTQSSQRKSDIKDKLKDILDVDVNPETKDMINDIVESFEQILTDKSSDNQLAKIMEISQKISVKYADKIQSGDIELDKIMKAIFKLVPGMDGMMDGAMGGMMSKMMSGMKGF